MRANQPSKAWEDLARDQSRWLYDLLRLLVVALVAFATQRILQA